MRDQAAGVTCVDLDDPHLERLARAAEAANHLPLEQMLDQVLATMLGGVPEDDVVLLALRMT